MSRRYLAVESQACTQTSEFFDGIILSTIIHQDCRMTTSTSTQGLMHVRPRQERITCTSQEKGGWKLVTWAAHDIPETPPFDQAVLSDR